MSSELHYLDIILKIENLTLMSSASGKFDINVLSIWENHLSNTHIFVILPVLFLFSHILNASEQLQLLIYALLSLKCRELHLRVFYNKNLNFACLWCIFLMKKKCPSFSKISLSEEFSALDLCFQKWICENLDIIFDNLDIIFEN